MLPPPLPETAASLITNERLRLLSWGYYISAGVGFFCAFFFLMYTAVFGIIAFIPDSAWATPPREMPQGESASPTAAQDVQSPAAGANRPPVIIFRIVAAVMGFLTVIAWGLCFSTFYAGRCIQKRKHRLFIMIMAAYNTLWLPYGTLLGVLSFLVLNSEESKTQFQRADNCRD